MSRVPDCYLLSCNVRPSDAKVSGINFSQYFITKLIRVCIYLYIYLSAETISYLNSTHFQKRTNGKSVKNFLKKTVYRH